MLTLSSGMHTPSFDGYTPRRQLEKIAKRVRKITKAQGQCWRHLKKALGKENITVRKVVDLTDTEREELALFYARSILPLLTPIAVDPAHPFPHMPNLGFGVVLSLKRKNVSDQTYAIIPVPSHVPRFIAIGKKKRDFVTIEDVLENFAPALFPDAVVTGDGVFRITRDSDIAVDEEAEDLVRHFDYKTHAKVSLVVRREGDELRTYTHLGTGNYHAQNAKIYTDLALFTADPAMGRDVGKLFNYVTSYSQPRDLEKLIIAPIMLRESIIGLIQHEMDIATAGGQGVIWIKLNALVDAQIIDKLYEASQAGVQIDLIVRGICCLRPGVEGLSENIRVKSIIGRYLEHPFSAHDYFMQNPSLSGRGSSLDVSAPKELDIKKPKAPPKTTEKAVNAK